MEIAKIECYVTDRLCLREIFVYTRGWFLLFGWLVGFSFVSFLVLSLDIFLSISFYLLVFYLLDKSQISSVILFCSSELL